MNPLLAKIFGGARKNIVDSIGKTLDNLITNKEELAAAKLEAEKEINRHIEAIQTNANKELELMLHDKDSARHRETEFVKATGHIDYMMYFLAIIGMAVFSFIVWHLVKEAIPEDNREIIIHVLGIVEGAVLGMYQYYWGSSAGSRVKDLRK
jgi:uncharacterized membrane protein (DUF106 family)